MKTKKGVFLLFAIIFFLPLSAYTCSEKNKGVILLNDDETKTQSEVNVLIFRSSSSSDHEMIQKAIDYAVKKRIPVVYIPAGEYNVEASVGNSNTEKGISLRDNIHLKLDDKAILKAIPNSSSNYSIISIKNISNAKITGGKIRGERNEHTGNEGEWGMGINILDSRSIEIENIFVEDCWGDGIYVGGANPSSEILIDNVRCENNRRQGISVVNCDGMIIKNSTFSLTKGIAPQSGVDLEPNKGQMVKNIKIDSCNFVNNTGWGFLIYAGTGLVSDIELRNSYFEKNVQSGINLLGGDPMIEGIKNLNQVNVSCVKIYDSPSVGMNINEAMNITVDSIIITKSAEKSLMVENSEKINFSKIYINDFVETGISILNTNRVKVSSGHIFTEKTNAKNIELDSSIDLQLNSLNVEGGMFGIHAKKVSSFITNQMEIKKQSKNSLHIEDSNTGELKKNTFTSSAEEVCLLLNSNKFIISDNSFNTPIKANILASVSFLGNSSENQFLNNKIQKGHLSNKPLYGIYLGSQSSLNRLIDNVIFVESYSVGNIKDEGSNNQILSNSTP